MSAGDATIHRVPHKRSYTMISNKVIKDKALSFKALGVLVYLLSKPDNWKTRVSELAGSHDGGAFAVKKAMGELEQAGYLVRRVEAHGRFGWDIHEKPQMRENRKAESEDQIRDNRDSEGAETADLTYAKTARVVSTEVLVSTDLASTDSPSPNDDGEPPALFAFSSGNDEKTLTAKRARGSKPKSSPEAHRLATLAFEQTPKPVTRGGFPGVQASFERILQAGYPEAQIERAVLAGIDGWTDQAILFAITKANGSKASTRREAQMGTGPITTKKVKL